MQRNTHFIRHEQCPECRRLGNDRKGNNLGVYSDGSVYCFKCGYSTGRKLTLKQSPKPESTIVLPADITTELPAEACGYLGKYSISRLDVQKHHIMWSEYWRRLIFPYFDSTGLLAWQGRLFGDETNVKAVDQNGKQFLGKWYSKGKIHEIIHPIKVIQREAVLVEDILSAIRVSSILGAIPIFGSSISTKQWCRLKTVVDRVYLWLDPDMRTKSLTMASVGNLVGIETHIIFSSKDPKDHTHDDISNILGEAQAKAQSNVNSLLPILSDG